MESGRRPSQTQMITLGFASLGFAAVGAVLVALGVAGRRAAAVADSLSARVCEGVHAPAATAQAHEKVIASTFARRLIPEQ